MDDLGNILYVILTIVVIIGSLLGKKKKADNPNKTKSIFQELFDTEPYGSSAAYNQEDYQESELYSEYEDDFLAEEQIEQKPVIATEQLLYNNNSTLDNKFADKITVCEIEEDFDENQQICFNLKQAVIHSTILERKYF